MQQMWWAVDLCTSASDYTAGTEINTQPIDLTLTLRIRVFPHFSTHLLSSSMNAICIHTYNTTQKRYCTCITAHPFDIRLSQMTFYLLCTLLEQTDLYYAQD